MYPIEKVVQCINWIDAAPMDVVSGRNFSAVHDAWDTETLEKFLVENPDAYKLRRNLNDVGLTP